MKSKSKINTATQQLRFESKEEVRNRIDTAFKKLKSGKVEGLVEFTADEFDEFSSAQEKNLLTNKIHNKKINVLNV